MANREYILSHYKNLANAYGLSAAMSMQDQHIRRSELYFFIHELKLLKAGKVLDLGCGNGYLIEELKKNHPEIEFVGLELSQDLFELCQKRKDWGEFYQGDMLSLDFDNDQFDVIITERSLINLLSWKEQKIALGEINRVLKTDGHYLLSESFKATLYELNQARKESGLIEIKIPKHNCYLGLHFKSYMDKIGFSFQKSEISEHHLSSHFFISRVLHESMRGDGDKFKSSKIVDFMTQACPPAIGHYSPILLQKYQKYKNCYEPIH